MLLDNMVTDKFEFLFEVYTGEFPAKRTGHFLVSGLEVQQAFFYSLKI